MPHQHLGYEPTSPEHLDSLLVNGVGFTVYLSGDRKVCVDVDKGASDETVGKAVAAARFAIRNSPKLKTVESPYDLIFVSIER